MGETEAMSETRHVRTLFLSDVHLGTRGCQAAVLLDFLKVYEADTIYLVGDIVDGWRLRQSWYWPQSHNDVVQKLLRKVRKGTRVIYIPGNHDEFFRDYVGSNFGGIEVEEEAIHRCADGRSMFILHGDKFDTVVRNVRWLALLGDWAYDFAIWLNGHIARVRRHFGLPYWSFSQWSKDKVKRAVSFISAFEQAVVTDARRHGVDMVLCGHIHKPTMRTIDGVLYINTGDWVESCSAVVENADGRLELIHWHQVADAFAPVSVKELSGELVA
ncbi:MAG: UDP-2,3-diacylglucosamine hydrolase [Rhizobiales bacterium 62-17]|nr:UDP-2,3-diacylglucosamine diphosphatase [Hyphomicrobiales bacterium]OJY01220.1 MAG: UDP-2,3-diacylglucosamine hydrolase [Rhizobiales bacterium 62-17]